MGFWKSTIQEDDEVEDMSDIKQLYAAGCGGDNRTRCHWSWRIPFKIFATIILSLPIPLSFLLLARLSAVHCLSLLVNSSSYYQFPPVFSTLLFIYNGKSIILYSLVAIVTVAAFIQRLTSIRFPLNIGSPTPEPPISGRHPTSKLIAWFLHFMFLVYVVVGTAWSISAGINVSVIAEASSNDVYMFTARALLFVGLHETMSFWSKYVAKTVVEDGVGGGGGGGGRSVAERVGVALTLGAVWWFKLRDEVDFLMLVPELILRPIQRRRDVVFAVIGEFGGWWLYALTSLIGSIRVLKGIIWVVSAVLTSSRRKFVIETSSESVLRQSSRHQLPPLEDVV